MTTTQLTKPRIAGAVGTEQRPSIQAGMFRGYVIIALALISWACVIAAVGVGVKFFSN